MPLFWLVHQHKTACVLQETTQRPWMVATDAYWGAGDGGAGRVMADWIACAAAMLFVAAIALGAI